MSSRQNRRQQMRAAKERRQKQIAIGGAVLLAVLLAIQAPRLMHRGGSSAPATAAAQTTATGTTPGVTTTTPATGTTPAASAGAGAAPAAGVATTSSKLPNSDVVPKRLRSQLASFELFDSKDPFVQQVSEETAPAAGTSTAAAPSTAGTPSAGTTAAAPATPAAPSTTSASTTQQAPTVRTLAHNAGAVIEVNGKSERVSVGETFPSSSPTFKLESLANGVAMIGIARGAYASGAQTVALQTGRMLTLVDTTDGVRYELRLVSSSS